MRINRKVAGLNTFNTVNEMKKNNLALSAIIGLAIYFAAFTSTSSVAAIGGIATQTEAGAASSQAVEQDLDQRIKNIEYIRSIGYTLLHNAVELCGKKVVPSVGIFFTNTSEFKPPAQQLLADRFGLTDRLKIIQLLADYPGRRQGLLMGDELVSLDNMAFSYGKDALPGAHSLLASRLVPNVPNKFLVRRNDRLVALSLTPDMSCDYPVIASADTKPYAYSNGQDIVVSQGVLQVLQSREYLASLIAHELAHNIMGHVPNIPHSDPRTYEYRRLSAIHNVGEHNFATPESAPIYSPAFEVEADHLSVYLLAMSNFPLRYAADLLKILYSEDGKKAWGERLERHPYTAARIEAISQTIKDIEERRANGLAYYPDLKKLARLKQIRADSQQLEKLHSSVNGRDQARVWAQTSFEYLQKNAWSDAAQAATSAIAIDANFYVPYINRSLAYLHLGQVEDSIRDSNIAISLNPQAGEAYNNRGYAKQELGRLEEAKADYRVACALHEEPGCENYKELTGMRPDNIKDLVRQLNQGNYVDNFNQDNQSANIKAKVANLVAQSYTAFAGKNWKQVIQLSDEILSVDPGNLTALANRAGALAETGQLTRALDDCNKAISIDNDYALAHHNKGYIYELMGQVDKAIMEYQFSCGKNISASCSEHRRLTQR